MKGKEISVGNGIFFLSPQSVKYGYTCLKDARTIISFFSFLSYFLIFGPKFYKIASTTNWYWILSDKSHYNLASGICGENCNMELYKGRFIFTKASEPMKAKNYYKGVQ